MRKRTANELRCFCSRSPLLAVYGLDERRKLYLHVKIYKQSRIYGEVVVTGGTVRIHCRECLRWHRVVLRTPVTPALQEVRPPEVVESAEEATVDDAPGSD